MSKRYSLSGVNGTLELGKGGPLWKVSGSDIEARNPADSAYINVGGLDGTASQHFVTKSQLDAAVNGLSWKEPVAVATTAAGTLATDFENGDTIDGVVLVTGDRILIKDQASGVENGIYTVNASGAPSRADDMPIGSDAASDAVFVQEGTANADIGFTCTNDIATGVVGTDALVFVQFASAVSGVTSVTSVGTGASLVLSTGPAATIRSLESTDSTITATVSGNEVDIVLAKVTQTAMDVDAQVATLVRYAAFGSADVGSAVNVGAVLGTNNLALRASVDISTVFDTSNTLELGISGSTDLLLAQADIDSTNVDTYVKEQHTSVTNGAQLILTVGAGAATTGAGTAVVEYIKTA